jgi:hypothetical protein
VTIAGIAGAAELRAIPGKVETVFRPELRKNKDLERSTDFEEEVICSGQKSRPRQKGP